MSKSSKSKASGLGDGSESTRIPAQTLSIYFHAIGEVEVVSRTRVTMTLLQGIIDPIDNIHVEALNP